MKHYDYVEWLLYKTRSLTNEKSHEMEEHLYNCDICLGVFLSLIDQDELNLASEAVPEDFTANLVGKINKNKVKTIQPKNDKKTFNYQFMYYIAVASVTIFLTMGGFYTNLVDSVPKIRESIQIVEEGPREMENHIGNFSEAIVSSTANLLFSIENMNQFKEEK